MPRVFARLFLACLCLCVFMLRPGHAAVVDIGNEELARLSAAGVPVIDIRTAAEWKETGVIPGSRLLTLFDERGRAEPQVWLERVRQVSPPGQPLIVICRSGNRTKAASELLSRQGGAYATTTIYNVKEGIRAWLKEGRPVVAAPADASTVACPLGGPC